MENKIIKLQWGGSIESPLLQGIPPALQLNNMALQKANLKQLKPSFKLQSGLQLDSFKENIGSQLKDLKSDFGNFSTKLNFNNFNPSNISGTQLTGIASGGAKMLTSLAGPKNEIAEGVLGGVNDIAGSFVSGPMGIAGKAIDSIGNAFNSKLKKSREGKAIEKGINTATTALTAVNPLLGLASKGVHALVSGIDNWTGRKSDTIDLNSDVINNSSYTGSSEDLKYADSLEGKYGGMFGNKGRRRANSKIGEAKGIQRNITGILNESKDQRAIQASSTDMLNNKYQLQQSGYLNGNNILFGRNGMKFILSYRKYTKDKENDVNLLPVGALHARKHNIQLDGVVTNKGIPVLREEKGGKISQSAEIEKNEIIFRPSVIEKLEELYKEGTDEAAIEAGKLLTREILYNTKDEGEFINTIE